MEPIIGDAIYHGITVDLIFNQNQPMFGDLFLICGYSHPDFPPSKDFQFDKLSELNFAQIDDYFGIENGGGGGVVWLFPLVGDEEVYHHSGPFTGLRLSYNVLRNPPRNKTLFTRTVRLFAQYLDVGVIYKLRNLNLGYPPDMAIVEHDIDQIIRFWKEKNIETGSEDALKMAY